MWCQEAGMTAECLVLAPQEALVAGAAEAFERQLQQMFRRACLQLVVDLSGVHAIDNAGLQALLRAQATGARSGGSLRLAAARPVVLTRLEDAQLQHVFALYGSVRAARVAAWPWRTIGIAAAGVALCGALVWGGLSNQKFLGRLKWFVLRNNTQEGSGMHE
jgi:anti-anti-sigma factor